MSTQTTGTVSQKISSLINEPLPMLLSVRHAPLLGFSRATFYRLVHSGEVSVVTVGERLFIPRDSFFDWLEKHST